MGFINTITSEPAAEGTSSLTLSCTWAAQAGDTARGLEKLFLSQMSTWSADNGHYNLPHSNNL